MSSLATTGRVAAIVLAILGIASCVAAESVMLKEEVYVKGPKLYLGDVAELSAPEMDSLGSIEIGTAASPGSTKRLQASYIEARIRNASDLHRKLEVTGARTVHATTLYLEVSREMLAEDLRRFIELEMPWNPNDAVIEVDPVARDLTVPDGEIEIAWRPNPRYRYNGSTAFRGDVYVDSVLQRSVTCRATVEAYTDVIVAVSDIPRGSTIGEHDIELQKRAISDMRDGGFGDVSELDGYVARTTIFPGQVISRRKVTPRRIIKRNQLVTVQVVAGTLIVEGQAVATEDGCEGDLITVRNPSTKQQFTGLVRSDGTIRAQ